jgi:hypothetical protein
MPLQITTCQGEDVPDEVVDVEQDPLPGILPEARSNALDYRARAKTVIDDAPISPSLYQGRASRGQASAGLRRH